jgi:hypothetical protein
MPKGPKGEKRSADVIGAAVKVMKIAGTNLPDTITNAAGLSCLEKSRRLTIYGSWIGGKRCIL